MRRARRLLNGQTRREIDRHAERVRGGLAFAQIGIFHPFFRRGRGLGGHVGITRANDRRIREIIHAIGRDKQFGVAHFHDDFVARHDVGDVHLKDVRPLLLKQRRAFAFLLGLFILLPRFFALLDFGDNRALADGHFHGIDGRSRRAGENVDRFKRRFPFIFIHLLDAHVGDDSGDIHLRGRGFERQRIHCRIVAFDEKVRR